jgi:hypothetical protein
MKAAGVTFVLAVFLTHVTSRSVCTVVLLFVERDDLATNFHCIILPCYAGAEALCGLPCVSDMRNFRALSNLECFAASCPRTMTMVAVKALRAPKRQHAAVEMIHPQHAVLLKPQHVSTPLFACSAPCFCIGIDTAISYRVFAGCSDGYHCCPPQYPICDPEEQQCTNGHHNASWTAGKKHHKYLEETTQRNFVKRIAARGRA